MGDFEKIMIGFKQWNMHVISGTVSGLPNRNYIEQITRTFAFKDPVETT